MIDSDGRVPEDVVRGLRQYHARFQIALESSTGRRLREPLGAAMLVGSSGLEALAIASEPAAEGRLLGKSLSQWEEEWRQSQTSTAGEEAHPQVDLYTYVAWKGLGFPTAAVVTDVARYSVRMAFRRGRPIVTDWHDAMRVALIEPAGATDGSNCE